MDRREVIELPPFVSLAGHAGGHLVEATVGPLVQIYAALHLLGLRGALSAGVLWSYAALGRRLILRPFPGSL